MDLFIKNLFFNAFTLIFIFYDATFWDCKCFKGKILNVLHQYVCSLILFLGPLYGYYKANIVLMIGALVGWIITGRCFMTVMTNKYCKHKKSITFRNVLFHIKEASIPLFAGKKDYNWWASKIDYGLLIVLIMYNIYMAKIIKM